MIFNVQIVTVLDSASSPRILSEFCEGVTPEKCLSDQ